MLPRLSFPLFSFDVPSTKQKIQIRSMVSREEKILLYAKESKELEDIFRAIQQVCQNCVTDDKFNVQTLTMFDLDSLFLKIRSLSVSNKQKVSYVDNEDTKQYDFEIDIDKVNVRYPEESKIPCVITITADVSISLKYPSCQLYTNSIFLKETGIKLGDFLIDSCIDTVKSNSGITSFRDETNEDRADFIDSLPITARNDIMKFVNNLPSLYHKLEYTNEKGTKRSIELTTLSDFFQL